jgi:hypothetical protein
LCGSTRTWVEWRNEHGSEAGEWPYAVCESCGHAAAGRRTTTPHQSPHARAGAEPAEEHDVTATAADTRPSSDRRASARPTRPKATDERVEELLAAAGYNASVTAEVLEQHRRFATHAGKPGLPRWKAAVSVLNAAKGAPEVPHVREIYAEAKRRREVRRARAVRVRDQATKLADEHAVAARAEVARVWAETGEGPTWRELAAALGVKSSLASAMVDALHRRGALASTKEPRSLTVTPDWTPPSTG